MEVAVNAHSTVKFDLLFENGRLKVLRDIVSVQYFLPVGPFKPALLINTPLQFTENASWQAEIFKCAVH